MTCSPIALVAEAGCFNCLTQGQRDMAMLALLCNILTTVQSIAASAMIYSGNGDPNGVITANLGSIYIQLDAPGVIWAKVADNGLANGWASNS